jgi:hypothetical protein
MRRERAATDVPHGRASISIRCRRQSHTPCGSPRVGKARGYQVSLPSFAEHRMFGQAGRGLAEQFVHLGCRERILVRDELPYILAVFLRFWRPNDLHEILGMRARRAGCFNLFVCRTLFGSEGSPAGFDFLAQKVVVISGFALSSHILAEQFTGNLGRWLVRCLAIRLVRLGHLPGPCSGSPNELPCDRCHSKKPRSTRASVQ